MSKAWIAWVYFLALLLVSLAFVQRVVSDVADVERLVSGEPASEPSPVTSFTIAEVQWLVSGESAPDLAPVTSFSDGTEKIYVPRVEDGGGVTGEILRITDDGRVTWDIDPHDEAAIERAVQHVDSSWRGLIRSLARYARHERFR